MVVPLAPVGCEGLDCWSGSLEAALCWAPPCVRVKWAPAEFSPLKVEPPLTAGPATPVWTQFGHTTSTTAPSGENRREPKSLISAHFVMNQQVVELPQKVHALLPSSLRVAPPSGPGEPTADWLAQSARSP